MAAQVTWQYSYGGYGPDQANAILAAVDGSIITIGATGSFGSGSSDIYVIKVDQDGSKLWSATYGGAGIDQGQAIAETADGGFVIAGYTNSSGAGGYDGLLVKINGDGVLEWQRTFGGSEWDFLYSVVDDQTGGFMLVGETFSSGSGGSDAWVLKLNDTGELIWERTYGGEGMDDGRCIRLVSTGGAVICGGRSTGVELDAWIARLDSAGDMVWQAFEGGDSTDHAVSLIETADGGFVAVGSTKSYSAYTEALQFKVDMAGVGLWRKNWGQINDQESFGIRELDDGRLLSIGYVKTAGSGGRDMFILFTTPNGDFLSGVSNGGDNGTGDEVGLGLDLLDDGGYVFSGYTESFGFGGRDMYLVRTDSVGLTSSISVISEFDPLGIDVSGSVRSIALHPNPASTTCSISDSERIRRVQLYDPLGRLQRQWSIPIPVSLGLQGLPDGLYTVMIIDDKGARQAAPLMIQSR